MEEERREGMANLETRMDQVEVNQSKMLDEMLGEQHPLTSIRSGGMRGDIGTLAEAVGRLEYKANNGGVNAKVKVTFWQKLAIAMLPVVTVALLALLQALLERG